MRSIISIIITIVATVYVLFSRYYPPAEPIQVTRRPVPINQQAAQPAPFSWNEHHDDLDKTAVLLLGLLKEERYSQVDAFLTQAANGDWLTRDGRRLLPELIDRWWDERYGEKRPFPVELEDHLTAWVEQIPDSATALIARGRFFFNLGWHYRGSGWAKDVPQENWQPFRDSLKKARQDFLQALALDPKHPHAARYLVALSRADKGLTPEMHNQYFMLGASHLPEFYGIYRERLIYLMPKWSGTWQEMFTFARQTRDNAQRGSLLPLILADAHQEAGNRNKNRQRYLAKPANWEEIHHVFEQVLEDFPQSARLRAKYARLATYAGKLQLAKNLIAEAMVIDPDDYDTLRIAGYLHMNRTHEWPALETVGQRMGSRYPDSYDAFAFLGHATMRQMRYEEAVAAFSRSLAIEPDDEYTWMNRGTCYFELRQYEEAIADFDQAIQRNPHTYAAEWSYHVRAKAHQRLGNAKQAETDRQQHLAMKRKRTGKDQ